MKKQLIIILFSIFSFCWGQSGDFSSFGGKTINTKITTVVESLDYLKQFDVYLAKEVKTLKLQSLLDNPLLVEQSKGITSLNNNVDKINKYLGQLDLLISRISNANVTLLKLSNELDKELKKLTETAKLLDNLRQLFKNPINLANYPKKRINEQMNGFLSSIKNIEITFKDKSQKLNEMIEKTSQKIKDLNGWKITLDKFVNYKLSNKSTEVDALKRQQLKLEEKASKLQNKFSQNYLLFSLKEIEKQQADINYSLIRLFFNKIDQNLLLIINNNSIANIDLIQLKNNENLVAQQDLQELEKKLQIVNSMMTRLNNLDSMIKNYFKSHEFENLLIQKDSQLKSELDRRLESIAYQKIQLKGYLNQLSNLIAKKQKEELFNRVSLSNFQSFSYLGSELQTSFIQSFYQITISLKTIYQRLLKDPVFLIFFVISAYIIYLITNHFFTLKVRKENRSVTQKNSYIFFKSHKFYFVLCYILTAIYIVVLLSQVPFPSGEITHAVMLGLFSISTLVFLNKLKSLEILLNSWLLSILILLAILLGFLYAISILSNASLSVVIIYEKLLMLTLLPVTFILNKKLKKLLHENSFNFSQSNLSFAKIALKFLFPLLVISYLLGMIGYTLLAWHTLRYITFGSVYLLLIIIGFLVIKFIRKKVKLLVLKHYKLGSFIAQDLVSPLSTIIQIVWAWLLTLGLFDLLKWDKHSLVFTYLLKWINYPIFSLVDQETAVSVKLIAISFLAIYLVVRVAKWLKSFSYHWLYSRINDLGVRHSLSVFSQYIVVLAGVLLTLKFLGIDLTSLAVFAGALGVGIGLGLQDIAKNFISGILLLVERPLESGDWVIIEGNEGYIKSIGMRAITMETMDNQEVIIPNGSVINNSFTNNTHSNTIMRTVVYVGADYDSDPDKVIQILHDVMYENKGVLITPEPLAILWEYGDSSINYRIQYYIDVDKEHLYKVRTALLHQIWVSFKRHGVIIPFPQRVVEIKRT